MRLRYSFPTSRALKAAVVAIALSGCGPDVAEEAAGPSLATIKQEVACGPTDDRVGVNSYTGQFGVSTHFVQNNKFAVGMLVMATGSCTGTLIACDLFLTAHHCVDGRNNRSEIINETPIEVIFNFESSGVVGSPEPEQTFPVLTPWQVELVPSEDVAIIRLGQNQLGQWACQTQSAFGVPALHERPAGSLVTIMQHPAGTAMSTHSAPTVTTPNGGTALSYLVDTQSNSSGSGVLNAWGEVLGVHTTGTCQDAVGANSGTSMFHIRRNSSVISMLTVDVHHADFNGDGASDTLYRNANRKNGSGVSNGIRLKYANGSPDYVHSNFTFCTHPTAALRVGDVDGDGLGDLICHDVASGTVWVNFNVGTGHFTGTNVAQWNGNFCRATGDEVHLGDFNGDGRADLLCHNRVNGNNYIAWANLGSSVGYGDDAWFSSFQWCFAGDEIHVADVNGDGRKDWVCHRPSTGFLWTAIATPSGTFTGTNWQGAVGFCAGTRKSVHVGRFTGSYWPFTGYMADTREDILCHNHENAALSVWRSYVPSAGLNAFTHHWSSASGIGQVGQGFCYRPGNYYLKVLRRPGDGYDDLACHAAGSVGGGIFRLNQGGSGSF